MDFQALSAAYTGATATGYDARRIPTAKWLSEDNAVRELLRVLPVGARILDMPVGTGRFLQLYQERGIKVAGRDISSDMLRAARNKLNELGELECSLEIADIRAIPDADNHYDCILSIRFLNWMDSRGLEEVLRELRRVSKRHLIVGIRHKVSARDLLLLGPKGWRRLLIGHLLEFRRWMRYLLGHEQSKKARTIQHKKDVVLRTFSRLNLRIDSLKLVEHGRDGTDYCLYRLIKDASESGVPRAA
jgi:SAM-dependent methyltransferase